MVEQSYRRADVAFFADPPTSKAIVEVAGSKRLVIYCGAGTTIDRTNLSWGDLIASLMEAEIRHKPGRLTPDDARTLRSHMSPLELASIYEWYVAENSGVSDPDEIRRHFVETSVPRLQELLYQNAGAEAGVLTQKISELAAVLVGLDRVVDIVTTNYDVYLEEELSTYLRELGRTGRGPVPGLEVLCTGDATFNTAGDWNIAPIGTTGIIRLHYLHGRVPRSGAANGHLALTERDYHEVRDSVVKQLIDLFAANLLILGSSLTDPPLLYALHRSNARNRSSRRRPVRLAVLPATSTGLVDEGAESFPRLAVNLQHRLAQFGLRMVVPDFHGQVAQFCQEVHICASMGKNFRDYATSRPPSNSRYGERLCDWWDRWEHSASATDIARTTTRLSRMLTSVVSSVDWPSHNADEVLKVELWVRESPRTSRGLTLWAGSGGILKDRTNLKREPLDLDTHNASVRAFIEGKPLWISRSARVGASSRRLEWINGLEGRWDSYLAVPVRLDTALTDRLPVGVVTVAGMLAGGAASNVPVDNLKQLTDLIARLRLLGSDILRA